MVEPVGLKKEVEDRVAILVVRVFSQILVDLEDPEPCIFESVVLN